MHPAILLSILLTALVLPAAGPAAAEPAFPTDEAWSYLLAQCEMGPRNPGSAGHERCAEWIAATLEGWGYRVERHRFEMPDPYGSGALKLVNLRAWRPGATGPVLALAAHWDTRPRAERDPDPARREQPILGANDGASGVAVLMALAHLCSRQPPPGPVEFLFFDGEDYGKPSQIGDYLLGSRRFVRDHTGYRPVQLILLDLVGGRHLQLPMERNSLAMAPALVQELYRRAAELDLGAFMARPGYEAFDDHVPFLAAGIPAVDLIDLEYPEWHTQADRPEACDPASLDQVGTLLVHYLFSP
jgi:hypothetical protein